jgi:hypothetical protein
MSSRNSIVLSSTIAALISVTSSVAHAAPYEANALALQVRAATVHAPTLPRTIYQSPTGNFRIEARFSFGSRTPFIENLESFFTLTSIESGEAYEVRVFFVDTKGGGGTAPPPGPGGGMGPPPGPGGGGGGGGGGGTTCTTGLDLPWSFSRSRIDPASETAQPILGPWTGWIPADVMRNMIYNHLPGICPPMRLAEVQMQLNANSSAVIAALQAFMADPHVDDFDPAFDAVALGKSKMEVKQFWSGLAGDMTMILHDAEHQAADAEHEMELIDDQMDGIPCAAPPNQMDADRCKALGERVAMLEKKFAQQQAIQAEAAAKAAEAQAKADDIQNIQIFTAVASAVCGSSADVARGILMFGASRGLPKFMLYGIVVDSSVSAICITTQMRVYAKKPTPLSASYVYAQMGRSAVLFALDSVLLYTELQTRKVACAGAAPCMAALDTTYFTAWRTAGVILVGALLLNSVYDKAIAPNLPW